MYFHGNEKCTCKNLLILRANCPSTWIHFDHTCYFIGNSCIIAILHSRVGFNNIWARQWCGQDRGACTEVRKHHYHAHMTLKHTILCNIAHKSLICVFRSCVKVKKGSSKSRLPWMLSHWMLLKDCFSVEDSSHLKYSQTNAHPMPALSKPNGKWVFKYKCLSLISNAKPVI